MTDKYCDSSFRNINVMLILRNFWVKKTDLKSHFNQRNGLFDFEHVVEYNRNLDFTIITVRSWIMSIITLLCFHVMCERWGWIDTITTNNQSRNTLYVNIMPMWNEMRHRDWLTKASFLFMYFPSRSALPPPANF